MAGSATNWSDVLLTSSCIVVSGYLNNPDNDYGSLKKVGKSVEDVERVYNGKLPLETVEFVSDASFYGGLILLGLGIFNDLFAPSLAGIYEVVDYIAIALLLANLVVGVMNRRWSAVIVSGIGVVFAAKSAWPSQTTNNVITQ